MKDVLLITHIATLSKKIAKGKFVEEDDNDLKELTSKLDSFDESTTSLGVGVPFGSFSFYQSQNDDGVISALGEWEEPELQQEKKQQVNMFGMRSDTFETNGGNKKGLIDV